MGALSTAMRSAEDAAFTVVVVVVVAVAVAVANDEY